MKSNELAFSLYKEFLNDSQSFSFSPISISSALSTLLLGAEGETADEIAKVLQYSQTAEARSFRLQLSSDKLAQLRMATSLWPSSEVTLAKSYLEQVNTLQSSFVKSLNYSLAPEESRLEINNWVLKQSAEKIADFFPPNSIDRNTSLVLANVIYFKGLWEHPFEKTSTSPGDFYTDKETKTPAQFMNQSGSYLYAEDNEHRLLEIPYKSNSRSFVLIVPKKRFTLSALEAELTLPKFLKLRDSASKLLANISIPRFKSDTKPNLQDALRTLGMKSAFTTAANFSRLTEKKNSFFISTALHQSVVEVNEEGTEASAATGFVLSRASMQTKPIEFRADEPFMFFIMDNESKSILFMGRIAEL